MCFAGNVISTCALRLVAPAQQSTRRDRLCPRYMHVHIVSLRMLFLSCSCSVCHLCKAAPLHDAQGTDLRASLTEVVGPQLFRLSFAYGAAVLIVQGGPAFRRGLAACQPELLRLSRRVGISVQLLATSFCAAHAGTSPSSVQHDRSCLG